jgi:hypothetical protein
VTIWSSVRVPEACGAFRFSSVIVSLLSFFGRSPYGATGRP